MRFFISGNLLRFSDFRNEIEVFAHTIEASLASLVARCPALEPVLFGSGRLRQVHRLFLNGAQIEGADLGQPVGIDDEVTILTAIAGG